jgi:hypothetical protein
MKNIHKPSQFVPTDYTVVDYIDCNEYNDAVAGLRDALMSRIQRVQDSAHAELKALRASINARNLRYFGTTDDPSKCDHCGTGRCRYFGVALHKPSGSHIAVGHTCAERINLTVDAFKFKQMQERAEAARTLVKRDATLAGFADSDPQLYAALIFAKRADADREAASRAIASEHGLTTEAAFHIIMRCVGMLCDIASKCRKYDYNFASEKQREFFLSASSLSKCLEWAKQADEREGKKGERDALQISSPVLSGRVVVSGSFVSLRNHESDFGTVIKGLFVCETHQKIWLTVPVSVFDLSKDESGRQCDARLKALKLTIKVTVEPSKDAGFYFGKRPSLVTA